MYGSLLGASFEGFVIDHDILGAVQRTIRGVEVSSDTLDLDAIEKTIFEAGHFLGGDQTLAAMQRDYYYPSLSDRESPDVWAEAGQVDMRARAQARTPDMLSNHFPSHISAELDDKVISRFKIHLSKEDMRAK